MPGPGQERDTSMNNLRAITAALVLSAFFVNISFAQFQAIPILPQPQTTDDQTTPQSFAPLPAQGLPIPAQLPSSQLPGTPQFRSPAIPQQGPVPPAPQAPGLRPELSEFEKYVTERPVQLMDYQLEALKRFEGIAYQYTSRGLPPDKTAIAVQVIGIANQVDSQTQTPPQPGARDASGISQSGRQMVIDAGYIVGQPDTLITAFKLLGIRSPLTMHTDIRQFGYDLFAQPPSTFAPLDKTPVGPDYVIGPGDELDISVWGRVEGQWDATVDRDGKITLPKIGSLGVAGLTFGELKDLLKKEFSKYYKGFEMSVSMGSLRSIRVYVVGYAQYPGAYTISSLSTLVNALFEAGGPGKTGSMRDIQLKRNGKTITHFDLYDLLLKGDKSRDVRLMPEDVVFIPPVGPLAAIVGNVHNPAIYELAGETRVAQLIALAGGLDPVAFKNRVQIERIVDNTKQVVFESNLEEIGQKDIKLDSGDIVQIFPIVQDFRMVKIGGAVQREGEYGFRHGMTVKDLITMSGGLKYYAYGKEAELMRIKLTQEGPRTEKIMISPERALSGDPASDIPLEENDSLFIRTIPDWKRYQVVTISGEVKYPGTYTFKKGERLSSLIERAGGYTDQAYLRGAVFVRQSVKEIQQKGIEEMADRLQKEIISQGAAAAASALPDDVASQKLESDEKQKFVDYLRSLQAAGRLTIRLAYLRLLKGSRYDITLEDGDTLYIPTQNSVVNVLGAVMAEGSFVYSDKLGYKDYVRMSGGFARTADTSNIYVIKADGSARKASNGFLGWDPLKSRWEISTFGEKTKELEPGDIIVVPEQLQSTAWLRNIKDITQILMQIAVVAGVVLKLYK